MALIAMAVFDTEENNRTDYTRRTIESLSKTVDWNKHRLVVVDNDSCEETKRYLENVSIASSSEQAYSYTRCKGMQVITLPENVGTAKAINKAWELRQPNEHCVKMDNDVVIHKKDWCDDLELAIQLDPSIGIVGLKRKDCWENPNHENPHYRSTLALLGGVNNRWLPIEKVQHVMGTCQMYNSALLDKIGYLYQPSIYGFDDIISAIRCQLAGFYSCFLPHIEIDHIDVGGDAYTLEKQQMVKDQINQYLRIKNQYLSGSKDIYTKADY